VISWSLDWRKRLDVEPATFIYRIWIVAPYPGKMKLEIQNRHLKTFNFNNSFNWVKGRSHRTVSRTNRSLDWFSCGSCGVFWLATSQASNITSLLTTFPTQDRLHNTNRQDYYSRLLREQLLYTSNGILHVTRLFLPYLEHNAYLHQIVYSYWANRWWSHWDATDAAVESVHSGEFPLHYNVDSFCSSEIVT
jgi:hypothetical protein